MVGGAGFELEAGLQRRLGDLELCGVGLGGRDPVLELVTGPGERPGDRMVGVPNHPREDLGRRRHAPDGRGQPRRAARAIRRLRGERGADRGGEQQRPDQVRPAPLVLLPARLAVLVRPDRDVLGAVVGGEARSRAAPASPAASDRVPPSSSRSAGPRRVDVRRPPSDHRARRASSRARQGARTAAAPPGSERRIRGRSAKASSSRIGPRSNGLVTPAPRTLFLPEATRSSPWPVRTATAHEVGPWTSTPFCSAMPPRRTLSCCPPSPSRVPRPALRPSHNRHGHVSHA